MVMTAVFVIVQRERHGLRLRKFRVPAAGDGAGGAAAPAAVVRRPARRLLVLRHFKLRRGILGCGGLHQVAHGFDTAEWGVAIGSPFWGTGIYVGSAVLVADFAFETLRVHRLEARAALVNGRANGALQKIGAVREGVLRRSFRVNGQYVDQILWSILREDWRRSRRGPGIRVH